MYTLKIVLIFHKVLHESSNVWLSMYDTEGNKRHICIRDNLFSCQQPQRHIHLKEKKQVLQGTNSKMFFVKRNFPLLKI